MLYIIQRSSFYFHHSFPSFNKNHLNVITRLTSCCLHVYIITYCLFTGCSDQIDLAVVLDASGSIIPYVKDFFAGVLSKITVGRDDAHVGQCQ